MFTGIITEVGSIKRLTRSGSSAKLEVECPKSAAYLEVGGSVAVCGVCLTATSVTRTGFTADLSHQTLAMTSLGSKRPGDKVNLELPMRAQDFIGGHLVSGHVEGVGTIVRSIRQGDNLTLRVQAPSDIIKVSIPQGSVTVEGVSLTITELGADYFEVVLIPRTIEATNLGALRSGDSVNLEADMIGRYVYAALQRGAIKGQV